jgi:hypothetical protein
MAINFPDSPTVNQEFTAGDVRWVWTGVSWNVVAKTSDPFIVSETAPESPDQGDQWYDSNTGATFVYYDGYWVELNNSLIGPQGEAGPQGAVGATGATGATGPTGVVTATSPLTYSSGTQTVGIDQSTLASTSGNLIINGGFDIWQRGTSFSANQSYTSDRFRVDSGTVTRQTGTAGIGYCLRISNSSGNPAIRQAVELPQAGNAGQFIPGSTWTVSFYARTSNSISSNLGLFVAFSTGVYNSAVTVLSVTNIGASSTNWTRYTQTFTINATPGGTNDGFTVVPYLNSGSYSGNFEITGVQLEAGAVATPFRRNAANIQGELAACQRYYQLIKSGAANSPTLFRIRAVQNDYYGMIPYLVKPRISTGFGYSINSPANIIHKPAVRWDTISNIVFTDMGTYLDVLCTPTVDDGSSMIGIHLYGINIFCNAEL